MREFLVSRFVCATCGDNLNLSSDAPKFTTRSPDGLPTGAAMVQQVVAIEPCGNCNRPLREMRAAVKMILDSAQK